MKKMSNKNTYFVFRYTVSVLTNILIPCHKNLNLEHNYYVRESIYYIRASTI